MAYDFAKGYLGDHALRRSFIKLARQVFGIDFENWFEKGYWAEKYIPFSYIKDGNVIANVSVNKITLVVGGVRREAFQIGTVMTHPDYRGQGLSKSLMGRVLEEYEGKYDVMYLFANETVLDFYPKFGFTRESEHIFYLDFNSPGTNPGQIRKLDMEVEEDRSFLYNFARERTPAAGSFGAVDTEELLMFYCLNVFRDSIYYMVDEGCIAIYEKLDGELHFFDLITKTEIDLGRILTKIAGEETKRIVFNFTPEDSNLKFISETYQGSEVLFARFPAGNFFPEKFKHPLTSQA